MLSYYIFINLHFLSSLPNKTAMYWMYLATLHIVGMYFAFLKLSVQTVIQKCTNVSSVIIHSTTSSSLLHCSPPAEVVVPKGFWSNCSSLLDSSGNAAAYFQTQVLWTLWLCKNLLQLHSYSTDDMANFFSLFLLMLSAWKCFSLFLHFEWFVLFFFFFTDK